AAHRDGCDQLGVGTDEDIVLDYRAVLVGAVVVAGDGAGADVDVAPDRGIPDVGQVVRFGARADVGFLHFHEIADVHFLRQPRARPQPRVGPDAAVGADFRRVDMGERFDAGARADLGVLHHAVSADLDVVTELHVALEYTVHIDAHVGATNKGAADVQAHGIGEGNPGVHQLRRVLPLLDALELRELLFAVDAEDFPAGARLDARHRHAVGQRERHDVGEVVLLLRIAVRQLGGPILQVARRQRHGAGIDFADLALLRARVFLLDDAGDAAAAVTNDAAVSGRV